MSRRKLNEEVALLEASILHMQKSVKELIDAGVPENFARGLGPKPEAIAYVGTMRYLFSKFDAEEIATKDQMLEEVAEAEKVHLYFRDNETNTSRNAVVRVAQMLFEISDEEIMQTRMNAWANSKERKLA